MLMGDTGCSIRAFAYDAASGLKSLKPIKSRSQPMEKTEHWENVYQTKSSAEVSWYEPEPKQPLELILDVAGESRGRVIDVGGGQSFLVDRLLDAGFTQVTVLDISQTAIEATKARMGERASQVEWIAADITQRDSLGTFDIWHDRAVFHFVTDPDDRKHYVELLKRSLPNGGHFIVETFAKGGPEKCSGLPICQYDDASMREAMGSSFSPVNSGEYLHTTPTGKPQQFFYGLYKRVN
jgi:2-polyprenyl-3-methyl-5-hydroxy-6-metoxy-1,4-benzoquinol methylase